jgi:hypothetical protein
LHGGISGRSTSDASVEQLQEVSIAINTHALDKTLEDSIVDWHVFIRLAPAQMHQWANLVCLSIFHAGDLLDIVSTLQSSLGPSYTV